MQQQRVSHFHSGLGVKSELNFCLLELSSRKEERALLRKKHTIPTECYILPF